MQPGADAVDVDHVLKDLLQQLDEDRPTNIGFPGAVDFDYAALAPFLSVLLNNVGDPYVSGVGSNHTKRLEVEVVEFFADLFALPADDRWGYVTSGGTEANLWSLRLARDLYPHGMLYYSAAAHDSIPKAADILGMARIAVRARANGEIDYDDLRGLVSHHRDRPAIVAATLGTTMTEAVDDITTIKTVLRDLSMDHFVHADAALAGIPLALDAETGIGVHSGADTICVSGHKFLGSPVPCAVVLTRDSLRRRVSRPGSYTGSPDTTITGSRSGIAPLILWYRLQQLGWTEGLRKRVDGCRELAEYAERRLADVGWPAWRNPGAMTVVIKTPPDDVLSRWMLASHQGLSHVICVPGVERDSIDAFVAALAASAALRPGHIPAPRRPHVPAGWSAE